MRMKSQPSPWVMVASVNALGKRCEPVTTTRLKKLVAELDRSSLARVIAPHEKIEPVDLFPHLAGDLLTRGGGPFFTRKA